MVAEWLLSELGNVRIGQGDISSRMQLFAKPALDTDGLQMRGT